MMLHNEFREAGYRVFGLHGIDNKGQCKCGQQRFNHNTEEYEPCSGQGKHPISAGWQHTPAWSDEQWDTAHELGQFDSGYGVLCRGLLVVDIDARNGGIDSFRDLVDSIPDISSAGLIVETGSGGGSKHLYFSVDRELSLLQHLDEYQGIDFKSSGYVVGPGSAHVSGRKYSAVVGTPYDISPAPQALLDLLERPEYHRADYDGSSVDVSDDDLRDMLNCIDNTKEGSDPYDKYIRVGMAIHHITGGTGIELWREWAARSYKGRNTSTVLENRWHGFGRSASPVTFGTLAHYAERGGWRQSVTFTPTVEFDLPDDYADGLPFDISGVDIKRPPGFVGEVAAWLESQNRRPREFLAVAGAITAVGNVIGLRYVDELDGVTSNIFAFCVAGSRTGKESVQQGIYKIHEVCGIQAATHGGIKSEQEILRNLAERHQAAFYVVDEIGILLQKIKNAQQRGGAIYLDGVIGVLMSAYGKSNGKMQISGDHAEYIKSEIFKTLARENKRQEDSGEDLSDTIDALEKKLKSIDGGIERPFLSLIGFTTPETFYDLVDFRNATNGFIGRSLIFVEDDTAPKHKKGFSAPPMPERMANHLRSLYLAGHFDMMESSRVEFYDDRVKIPTEPLAADMLSRCADWFDDEAARQADSSGLEALYLGAYELVSKISFILGAPGGIRTAEHVRWAFALVKRDVDQKSLLVTSNDKAKDNPDDAIRSRLLNLLSGDGMTEGVIINKLKSWDKSRVVDCLKRMVDIGELEELPGRRKPIFRTKR